MTEVPAETLSGKRILLVEDNFLVGASMRRMLESLGCTVIGPIAGVADGQRLAHEAEIDAGVLDINILGGASTPIAHELTRRGRGYFFVTGYGSPGILPADLKAVRRLSKPVDQGGLAQALRDVMV